MVSQAEARSKRPSMSSRVLANSLSGSCWRAGGALGAPAKSGTALPGIAGQREQQGGAEELQRALVAADEPPQAERRSASASTSMIDPAHQPRLRRRKRPRASHRPARTQQHRRRPERPGHRLERRIVAHPIAVARDQPGADLLGALAGRDALRGSARACRRPSRRRCRRSTGPGRRGSGSSPSAPWPARSWRGSGSWVSAYSAGGSSESASGRRRGERASSASRASSALIAPPRRRRGSPAMSCGDDRADMLVADDAAAVDRRRSRARRPSRASIWTRRSVSAPIARNGSP